MKVKYPEEAFALGIVLFSAGMKEAFAAGILVTLAVVFAEFLKNLLESSVPGWSLKFSVLIGTASVCVSAFLLGFTALGVAAGTGTLVMTFLVGLLAAGKVLREELQADYGGLFLECGIIWGFWVLLAVIREFMGAGTVFGAMILQTAFQSKSFFMTAFGFVAAGLALAFTNGVLKKKSSGTQSLTLVIPMIAFARPFAVSSFGKVGGLLLTILVPVVLFGSVKKTLKFSGAGQAYRGLPVEMLAMGFIYLILSIY